MIILNFKYLLIFVQNFVDHLWPSLVEIWNIRHLSHTYRVPDRQGIGARYSIYRVPNRWCSRAEVRAPIGYLSDIYRVDILAFFFQIIYLLSGTYHPYIGFSILKYIGHSISLYIGRLSPYIGYSILLYIGHSILLYIGHLFVYIGHFFFSLSGTYRCILFYLYIFSLFLFPK